MQLRAAAEAFDRFHRAGLALGGQHQAGKLRHAVDQHRAGAALAQLAAVLGAGEAEVLAQYFEQRLVAGAGQLDGFAVDAEAQLQAARHIVWVPNKLRPLYCKVPVAGRGRAAENFWVSPPGETHWLSYPRRNPPISSADHGKAPRL